MKVKDKREYMAPAMSVVNVSTESALLTASGSGEFSTPFGEFPGFEEDDSIWS